MSFSKLFTVCFFLIELTVLSLLFLLAKEDRCFYCENEGAKVVHPDSEKYNGCDIPFERMACEDLGGLTVYDSGDRLITHSVDICEEDCIYFDASRDVKCEEFLNSRASRDVICV